MTTILIAAACLIAVPIALGVTEAIRVSGYRPGDYDHLRQARRRATRRRR